ncbi:hypothetical protein [Capnocytophaga sp. oral taxon 903]|uniref:hypothetical protein n=1 Tax=Capnocytophaga sp. oral taxon 903 TaxID=2748317 RepID=UPI0015B7C0E4|nr:hypothetical protein [Capnocytophaga sp. oral taxon 903]NWO29156.1 hypothetical protein [Capnocytophaga sp. oral taxon 903]
MKQKDFEGKTIIIAMPNHFGLLEQFKDNLEFLGFEVFVLDISNRTNAISLKDKITHGYKKLFFGDRSYKPSIKNKKAKEDILIQLSHIKKTDYALFIRPDLFDFEVIDKVKQISKKTVAYQWDGLNRYPLAKKYINLFDKFYVFDKKDLNLSRRLKHTTNFYFDNIISKEVVTPKTVFFVGTYMKNRVLLLEQISTLLENKGLIPNIFLVSQRKKSYHYKFKIIDKEFSFKESILKMQKSEYLLDLHNPIHNGLSFRTFESIGYGKKLITNNLLVKEYDFYNPNNIFIIEKGSFDNIDEFLNAPYQPLEKEIQDKYSFSSWIKQLLK